MRAWKELSKSKRFWMAILGVIFMIIEVLNPTLAGEADTLIPATLVLIGIAVGGFSLEDAARANNTSAVKPKYVEPEDKENGPIPY